MGANGSLNHRGFVIFDYANVDFGAGVVFVILSSRFKLEANDSQFVKLRDKFIPWLLNNLCVFELE